MKWKARQNVKLWLEILLNITFLVVLALHFLRYN